MYETFEKDRRKKSIFVPEKSHKMHASREGFMNIDMYRTQSKAENSSFQKMPGVFSVVDPWSSYDVFSVPIRLN